MGGECEKGGKGVSLVGARIVCQQKEQRCWRKIARARASNFQNKSHSDQQGVWTVSEFASLRPVLVRVPSFYVLARCFFGVGVPEKTPSQNSTTFLTTYRAPHSIPEGVCSCSSLGVLQHLGLRKGRGRRRASWGCVAGSELGRVQCSDLSV